MSLSLLKRMQLAQAKTLAKELNICRHVICELHASLTPDCALALWHSPTLSQESADEESHQTQRHCQAGLPGPEPCVRWC